MNERPNILLISTDQQRGDCLGIDGHPVLRTPNLDALAAGGAWFRHAYSACPVCIAARRTLMTGRKPASHGVTMNYETLLEGPTLPATLTAAGYHTHLVGKLHLWPNRKLYGFMSADWSDGANTWPGVGDYGRFLESEGIDSVVPGMAHGVDQNSWVARPWHLDERLHFTNWCTDRAMRFLERRDPTVPFFLNVSYVQPHQPCVPPQPYWDRYMRLDLPQPFVGDWARVLDERPVGLSPLAWRVKLSGDEMQEFRAGYYGSINHIDDQIGRLLDVVPDNTVICFLSDHGEMLGDHQWVRKRNAFEPSVRVPMIWNLPDSMDIPMRGKVEGAVELMDVMPTILECAAVEVPDTVDGKSVLPLLRGEADQVHPYIHGECADIPTLGSGMQYCTDGREKYIWYPGTGAEQFFDLERDPNEMIDLSADPAEEGRMERWRACMVDELRGRPEGFVENDTLQVLGAIPNRCLPGYENSESTFALSASSTGSQSLTR